MSNDARDAVGADEEDVGFLFDLLRPVLLVQGRVEVVVHDAALELLEVPVGGAGSGEQHDDGRRPHSETSGTTHQPRPLKLWQWVTARPRASQLAAAAPYNSPTRTRPSVARL